MKRIIAVLLVFGVAALLATAHAEKGAKGHGHEKASSSTSGEHHSTAEGAMTSHGGEEHMKAMAEFQRTMPDNFTGLMGATREELPV